MTHIATALDILSRALVYTGVTPREMCGEVSLRRELMALGHFSYVLAGYWVVLLA